MRGRRCLSCKSAQNPGLPRVDLKGATTTIFSKLSKPRSRRTPHRRQSLFQSLDAAAPQRSIAWCPQCPASIRGLWAIRWAARHEYRTCPGWLRHLTRAQACRKLVASPLQLWCHRGALHVVLWPWMRLLHPDSWVERMAGERCWERPRAHLKCRRNLDLFSRCCSCRLLPAVCDQTIYFLMVTSSTVGYGDLKPGTQPEQRALTVIFMLVGIIGIFSRLSQSVGALRAHMTFACPLCTHARRLRAYVEPCNAMVLLKRAHTRDVSAVSFPTSPGDALSVRGAAVSQRVQARLLAESRLVRAHVSTAGHRHCTWP